MKVSKIKFSNTVEHTIKKAVDEIGGISQYVKEGETVFVKPNFNTADPPPASSDIAFVKEALNLIATQNPSKFF